LQEERLAMLPSRRHLYDQQFSVRSIDSAVYSARHHCIVRAVVDRNKLLVSLAPHIPAWVYQRWISHLPGDLEQLVLAPRHMSTSVTPISEWPLAANMCVPDKGGSWTEGPWLLLDIGLLERPEAGEPASASMSTSLTVVWND